MEPGREVAPGGEEDGMAVSSLVRGVSLTLGVWAGLGVLRYKPWHRLGAHHAARETLKVGFLPVT
jgi:hypothetical protein